MVARRFQSCGMHSLLMPGRCIPFVGPQPSMVFQVQSCRRLSRIYRRIHDVLVIRGPCVVLRYCISFCGLKKTKLGWISLEKQNMNSDTRYFNLVMRTPYRIYNTQKFNRLIACSDIRYISMHVLLTPRPCIEPSLFLSTRHSIRNTSPVVFPVYGLL